MTARPDGVYARPDWYTPIYDNRKHWTAVRGCHPDCPACEHDAEMAERRETDGIHH